MTSLPESVRQAWDDRDGPVVLATVGDDNIPNIIYVTCVGMLDDNTLVVADNYFNKTRENFQKNKKGSLLFIDKKGKSYQVKGTLEYHQEGEVFNFMKSWNPAKHPGHAALALKVETVFSGSEKLC